MEAETGEGREAAPIHSVIIRVPAGRGAGAEADSRAAAPAEERGAERGAEREGAMVHQGRLEGAAAAAERWQG